MKFFSDKHSKQHLDTGNGQDEIAAVITLAIHMYTKEMQEYENTIVTIQQVIKPYSPWSSKIYGLRQMPMRNPSQRPGSK